MPSALRQSVEYHAARGGLALIRRLSPAAASRLAGSLADLAFVILRRRRRIAVDNLLRAGVATTPAAARQLARDSFRHFGSVVTESFHATRMLQSDTWRERVELNGPAESWALLEAPGRGVLLVSGHLGNWEVAAQIAGRFKPVTGIARRMNNARVQELVEQSRMRGDFETIDKHDAQPRRLLRALREGRALAILSDQHAPNSNIWIDFFGRPASTYSSPAILHRLSQAPILFAAAYRTGLLRYRVELSEPLIYETTGDTAADARRITEDLARRLEAAIRKQPAQYLWAHRRWKHAPGQSGVPAPAA